MNSWTCCSRLYTRRVCRLRTKFEDCSQRSERVYEVCNILYVTHLEKMYKSRTLLQCMKQGLGRGLETCIRTVGAVAGEGHNFDDASRDRTKRDIEWERKTQYREKEKERGRVIESKRESEWSRARCAMYNIRSMNICKKYIQWVYIRTLSLFIYRIGMYMNLWALSRALTTVAEYTYMSSEEEVDERVD